MISLIYEMSIPSKIGKHLKKHWKVYGMGAGALGAGIAAGELADRVFGDKDHAGKDAITAARTAGVLGTGWAMKKKYDENESKKKKISEAFKPEKTADVIEKTGGRPVVGHLRKHWKKYATLAGAGLAASLAGEGMRLGASKKLGDAIAANDKDKLASAHKLLRKGEIVDTTGTTTTIGAGAAAGAGKLYDRRKYKRT
jgi:hypothetical protein